MKRQIKLKINGQEYTDEVEPRMLLVHFLRDKLRLTGTHIGCITGKCGACTIIWNGIAIKSCMMLTTQASGSDILTIEGLAKGEELHPLQDAFWESHGLQCGYCTPGMIMSAYQLLMRNPDPTEEQIRKGLTGNLCRCTGYVNIVAAVKMAAKRMNR